MWTDVGLQNFNNLQESGIDSYLCTPNGNLHRFLTKEAFKNLGHPFGPFIHGQKVVGPKIASLMNIKLVVYGENQAEYGNDIKDNQSYTMNSDFFSIDDNSKIEDLNIGVLNKRIDKKIKI